MDFTTLQTEFFAFGFEDWNDASTGLTRSKRLLNESYKNICGFQAWSFLQTTTTGTAPLTVSDLRQVIGVANTNTNTRLEYMPLSQLRFNNPGMPDTGAPQFWYKSSDTVIDVYPDSSPALQVQYIKYPTDLNAGADLPVIPTRFQFLIVLGAAILGHQYRDNSGTQSLQALQAMYDRQLGQMVMELGVETAAAGVILSTES